MMDDPREKRLKQMQKEYPFTPARDDLITDELRAKAGLGPLPRSAIQGVQDMRQRLEMLIADKAKLLKTMDTATGEDFKAFERLLGDLNHSIKDTEQRLAEYQTQGKGLN
jgi:hypothetical protein